VTLSELAVAVGKGLLTISSLVRDAIVATGELTADELDSYTAALPRISNPPAR
jgi:hypothetical protein